MIHAEQLFEVNEVLSESEVGERFEACNWPKLSSRGNFYEFIVRVERWLHDHLGRLHFPEEDEHFAEDAEMLRYLLEIGRRRQENDLFRQIYELVRDHEPPNQPRDSWTSAEELAHATWTQCLIHVICCGHQPSRDRKKERRRTRSYQPWGLFRFLRIQGTNDPQGIELNSLLVTGRNNLSEGVIIQPIDLQSYMVTDFGSLNQYVDQREREFMTDSSIRATVDTTASNEMLHEVCVVENLQDPISEQFQANVLKWARSGKPFDPKWTETIKHGFIAILMAGGHCPFDRIIEFLTKFHVPLLASYGALDRITEQSYRPTFPHELLDLFPDGWSISLSKQHPDPTSPQAKSLTLTILSGAGEERSVTLPTRKIT